ncbi:MAG: hypothetical protein GWO24_14585 [Akkermansiaceae bacterium]|nr:hypothetical protein [Akkermansiaceae bacterium]
MRNFLAPTSVNVARITYLLVCELAGIGASLSTKGTKFEIPIWIGVLAGLAVAGLILLLETCVRSFTLRGFTNTSFGILVGLFCAWLITKLGYAQAVEGIVVGIVGKNDPQAPDLASSINFGLNIFLFASLAFLGAVLAMRSGRDDFAFIIPYVRFRQDAASGQPLLLDADVIMDGRVARILASGFLTGRLIVPRFILDELKVFSASPSPGKRQRGQRGLDCLEEMQSDKTIHLSIHEPPESAGTDAMDTRLIQTARMLGARLLTTDENLSKVARLQNAEVLNINDLSDALKPAVVVGEKIHLALVRTGKDEHQAVGYLPDGTMIVVNHAASKIGTTQDVLVISTLQTSAGQMVFAELYEPDEAGG